MNINSHDDARLSLIEGNKLRNIYYSSDEFVFLNSDGVLQTEDGYTHGTFQDEFWMIQMRLPQRWHIVNN